MNNEELSTGQLIGYGVLIFCGFAGIGLLMMLYGMGIKEATVGMVVEPTLDLIEIFDDETLATVVDTAIERRIKQKDINAPVRCVATPTAIHTPYSYIRADGKNSASISIESVTVSVYDDDLCFLCGRSVEADRILHYRTMLDETGQFQINFVCEYCLLCLALQVADREAIGRTLDAAIAEKQKETER